MGLKPFAASTLAIFIALGSAAAYADESRFYNRKSEGWFWYNEEDEAVPEELEDPIIEPEPVEILAAEEAPEQTFDEPEETGPEILSAAWVRDALPKYLDKAWSDPTIENVRAYYYLQRFALDRSEQFALASQLAVLGDPLLDETARRPLATYAVHDLDRKKENQTHQTVKEIAKKAGLFFFYSPECESCEIQAPIIKDLERVDGFTVIPIAVNGARINSVRFDDAKPDQGHAEKLGVLTYPATYLATPDGDFSVVGQGAYALSEMRQRILLAASAANIITEDEFGRTRPILNHNTNIAERIPTDALEHLKQRSENSATDDGLLEPSELVRFFRENKGIHRE